VGIGEGEPASNVHIPVKALTVMADIGFRPSSDDMLLAPTEGPPAEIASLKSVPLCVTSEPKRKLRILVLYSGKIKSQWDGAIVLLHRKASGLHLITDSAHTKEPVT
jgi:hypothetical protein